MAQRPDEVEVDLEKTDKLPVLDVAAYEARLGYERGQTDMSVPESSGNEPRSQPLPPAETLQDIETWIDGQRARARSYERVIEELRQEHLETQGQLDNLARELGSAQTALHTALTRANEGERSARERGTELETAESRTVELSAALEKAARTLASAVDREGAVNRELVQARESLSAKAREHEEQQSRIAELVRAVAAGSKQSLGLENEVVRLRAHNAVAECELTQRAERLTALQADSATQSAALIQITRDRDALVDRLARHVESAQTHEWQRNVFESVWNEQDTDLVRARAVVDQLETERTDLTANIDKMVLALAERDSVIAKLTAARTTQDATFEAYAMARSAEQQTYAASLQQSRLQIDALAAETKALEERNRGSEQVSAARQGELESSRAASIALEQKILSLQELDSSRAARIAELEFLSVNLGRTLETQNEAVRRADDLGTVREQELANERSRANTIEAELTAAKQQLEQQATERVEADVRNARLSETERRLAELEHASLQRSESLTKAQLELAHVAELLQQSEASIRPIESELAGVRNELLQETERANGLDDAKHNLALELERTRGALDERDLQLRRLERHTNSSAQALSRIRVGIEREQSGRSRGLTNECGATLVPLNDSDAPPLMLGRNTTIGRSRDCDLRLKDSSISRRHAVVRVGPSGASIEDLRSVNGLLVNRRRVQNTELSDGDIIELGVERFRFTVLPSRSADAG
jgi:chromosome segregation ATPase